MRSSRSVSSTAAALYKVFVAPIEPSTLQFIRGSSLKAIPSFNTAPKLLLLPHQRRCYAAPAPSNGKPPPKRRFPRDEEIKSWSVALVAEDGKLEEPRSTYEVLKSIDRKTQSLVVVAPGEPGVPPVCKIMDKKAMRDAEKAKAKAARNSAVTIKTIELNWAIDGNDLGHRLNKMKEFLGKGNKVEVLMAGKRKGRKATEEEGAALVERIRGVVKEVEGAKETKFEGKILGSATLHIDGKEQKS